jgi:hypothetical protein
VRDDNGGNYRSVTVKLDGYRECRRYDPGELEPDSIVDSLANLA